MPKLHCIALHVSLFIDTYEYAGIFSEEGFETFQKFSKKPLSRHTHRMLVVMRRNTVLLVNMFTLSTIGTRKRGEKDVNQG